jgi:hypothetical protein
LTISPLHFHRRKLLEALDEGGVQEPIFITTPSSEDRILIRNHMEDKAQIGRRGTIRTEIASQPGAHVSRATTDVPRGKQRFGVGLIQIKHFTGALAYLSQRANSHRDSNRP